MKIYSEDDIQQMIGPEVWGLLEQWLDAGKGIAVYQNQDLGHSQLGHRQFISYGKPEAQIESDDPPTRMPDIGASINWRYVLQGVCRRGSGRE